MTILVMKSLLSLTILRHYATRVSILDSATGTDPLKAAPFGTWGRLEHISVEPDYFENGRPALLVWGNNNKLDGFHGVRRPEGIAIDEDEAVAHWDLVPVFVILNPTNMDGLGPPHTNRVNIPTAYVHAYAYP